MLLGGGLWGLVLAAGKGCVGHGTEETWKVRTSEVSDPSQLDQFYDGCLCGEGSILGELGVFEGPCPHSLHLQGKAQILCMASKPNIV